MYRGSRRYARPALHSARRVADWAGSSGRKAGVGDFSRCVQGRCPVRMACRRYVDQGDDYRSRIKPEAPLGSDCYYYKPINDEHQAH